MKIFNTQDTVFQTFGFYKFEIARGNNHEFRNKLKRLSKPIKKDIDKNTLTAKQEDALIARAMGGTVLVGWTLDVESAPKGTKEVPFSTKEAEDTLIEDDILRNKISDIAGDYDTFLNDNDDEAKKS